MSKEKVESTTTVIDLSGTVLEELATILNAGDFEPVFESPLAEGEVVIGEMNDFEKACITASLRFGKRADAMTNEAMEATESPAELHNAMKASSRRYSIFKAITNLIWASINTRLGEACDEGNGIGIRSGYKIVTVPTPKIDLPEGLPAELSGLLDSLSGNVQILGIGIGMRSPCKK